MQDIKNGGTPLHWAKEKEIIEALAESGCQLEAKDFNGDTALHVMARHERVDCVIGLICMGAQIDAREAIQYEKFWHKFYAWTYYLGHKDSLEMPF